VSSSPDWQRRVAETAQRHQRLHERVAALSITEVSRDGTVSVTVSGTGLLTDLVLRERWNPVPAPLVAAQVLDCVRRAQARIPGLLHAAVAETVGDGDPGAHLVVADARARFPEPVGPPPSAGHLPPRPPAAPAARPAPRAADRPDDDWDGPAVMEDA
jgi:hypothetical protein